MVRFSTCLAKTSGDLHKRQLKKLCASTILLLPFKTKVYSAISNFMLKWLIISKSLDLRAYTQDFKLNLLPIYYF